MENLFGWGQKNKNISNLNVKYKKYKIIRTKTIDN